MARSEGKCPVCGAFIYVNDEKELGHCGKCGAEIRVAESIRLLHMEPNASTSQVGNSVSTRRTKREAKERAAEIALKARESEQRIHDMFQLCANEQDYLMLRPKILEMNISDSDKAQLLEALDQATAQRLQDTIKDAKDYQESSGSVWSILAVCIFLAAIGLAINYFFAKVWPGRICIVLSVLCFIGQMQTRHDKKKKAAAELVARYRDLGYKI